MDLRASSLLWTGTGNELGLGAAGKCGGVGARVGAGAGAFSGLLSPELEERLSASWSTGDGASFGMRDDKLVVRLSLGDEGGVAKEVFDCDEPELRRESDGPAPGVGDIAG